MDVPQRTVVVVHGIGRQSAGSTGSAWIESFLRFCDAQDRRAEVVANQLEEDGSATLVVGAPGTGKDAVVLEPVLRLRIVEAHWADAFVAPSASSVLKWVLWFGPNLAHAQVFLSRPSHEYLKRQAIETMGEQGAGTPELTTADSAAHRASSSMNVVGPVLYLLGGLLLLAVAGPLVLVLALLALVAGLVPVNAVRTAAARVLSVVSAQVGDVSTFLTSRVARGAMEEIIDRRIRAEVARAGTQDVHVLAHSQGAALTHAVLLRLPPELRPVRFTTLGGAHGRLNDMRLFEFPRWTLLPILATALSWLCAFPIHGRLGWGGLLLAPGAVSLATLVLLLLAGRASAKRLGRSPSPGAIPGVSWLDVWAPFDPVHNGRPVARHGSGYLGQTVPGRMAFLLDHVYYEKDWSETVPRVLAHVTQGLEGSARLGATRGVRERKSLGDPAGEGPNWTPWSRRDWVSFVCRGLAVVLGIVLISVCGHRVMALGARLRGTTPWAEDAAARADALWTRWWELFGGTAGDVVGGTNRVIGGFLVLLAVLLVANLAKSLYWGAVEAEARDWALSLAEGEPRRWSVARWTRRGGAVVLVWAALLAALTWWVAAAPWA